MVVTVDVQDLLALDTKHTVVRQQIVSIQFLAGAVRDQTWTAVIYPERMHSVRPVVVVVERWSVTAERQRQRQRQLQESNPTLRGWEQ